MISVDDIHKQVSEALLSEWMTAVAEKRTQTPKEHCDDFATTVLAVVLMELDLEVE